jgi:site-specific DNA recombinase
MSEGGGQQTGKGGTSQVGSVAGGDRMRGVALIYVRRSMVRYDEDRASPERQLANCVAACQEKGWTHEVYEDAEGHRSGRSEKHRPAWQRLKAQLPRPEVVAVVVNSLDRASRSPRDFFVFLDLLRKHEVELVSVHEDFDTTTAIGKPFLAILMVVPSLESDLASERISDSIEHRRQKGVHVGIAPFGYDREKGRLVPNEDATVVGVLADLYARGQYGYREVAEELNRRGYRFKDQYGRKPFSDVSERSVLENVWLYAGRLPVGRERSHGYEQLYDGAHDALIGQDLAERVIGTRRLRSHHRDNGVLRMYLLTGVAYCHECGDRLWGFGRGSRGRAFYRHSSGTCSAGSGSWDAEEAEVLGLLDGLVLPAEAEEMVKRRVRDRALAQPGNADLTAALDREKQKLKRLTEMRLEGEIDREEYFRRKAEIAAVIAGVEGQLGGSAYDAEEALRRLANVGEMVRLDAPAEQKRVLHSVFERVEFSVETRRVARVEPRPWFRMLFADVSAWFAIRAWRDSNARTIFIAGLASFGPARLLGKPPAAT